MLTDTQLKKHQQNITGSKVGSILGLPGAYQSKYELFSQMKGYAESNIVETEAMEAGSCMELGIAEWCKRKYKWELKEGPKDGRYHSSYPFFYGLVDRLLIENGKPVAVIEFKNQDKFAFSRWEDGPPEIFKAQTYFYSQIYDLPGWIVACFGGNHFEKYELPRNPRIENFILKKCHEFWDDLANNRWPEPDGSPSCTETLKKLYDSPTSDMVAGTEEQLKLAIEYENAKGKVKDAEEAKSLCANKLKEDLKNNEGFIFSDGSKVTWKKTSPKKMSLNEKQLVVEYPEIYKRFLFLPQGYRSFRISIAKE